MTAAYIEGYRKTAEAHGFDPDALIKSSGLFSAVARRAIPAIARGVDRLRGVKVSRGGTFYHGGLPRGTALSSVDPYGHVIQNGRLSPRARGITRAGFYMTPERHAAEGYAAGRLYGYPNTGVHQFTLRPDARVARLPAGRLQRGIEHLTPADIKRYGSRYDAIAAPNSGGSMETVLLNRNAVSNMSDITPW